MAKMAAAVEVREANLFMFTGGRDLATDTQITYSTSSFGGERQLTYRDETREMTFRGDEASVASSPLGTLVTVTVEAVPDLHTVTATLVLPSVNLGDMQMARFRALLVLTTNRTSIGGPQLVVGPLQTYQTIKLKGVAQQVDF